MTKNEESNGPNFAGSLMNQTGKEFFLYIKKPEIIGSRVESWDSARWAAQGMKL